MIRLLGPPIARACTSRASHDWIGVTETVEGLDIWIDTTEAETRNGSVSLEGTTGTAAITIVGEVIPRPAKVRPSPDRTRVDGLTRTLRRFTGTVDTIVLTRPSGGSGPISKADTLSIRRPLKGSPGTGGLAVGAHSGTAASWPA